MGKKNSIQHLLIIRLSAMGDVAMLVPVILELVKIHPQLQITILTRKRFEPIFEEIPNISIFPADVKTKHKGIFGLFRLYRTLLKLQLDAVADTHNVLRSSILKCFFKFSGIPFIQINKGRKEKKLLTKKINKVFKPLKTTHERYADVFKALGLPITISQNNKLTKPKQPVTTKINLKNDVKLVGVAPFATHKSKMYPLSMMEEVLALLINEKNYQVVLFGGGSEEEAILQDMADKLGDKVINTVGKLSFKEELALISNLNVMLAMDSGNGHLAANYGVEVVTLWGVTHPYAGFAPYGQSIENSICADRQKYPLIPTSVYGNKFPEGYDKAMETIAPTHVFKTIVELGKSNN